jgi:hypothetical protein
MAIPRLNDFNEVTFDFVGEIDKEITSGPYVSNTEYQLESQYLTKVESDVENIFVDSMENQSAIEIPLKTVRSSSETSQEISNNTVILKMDEGTIFKPLKVILKDVIHGISTP